MSKIKFLVFLFFLGIVLYYWGKPHPLASLQDDFSKILGNPTVRSNDPWTRAGRSDDSVASDTRKETTESNDESTTSDKNTEKNNDRSIFDIFKSKESDNTSTDEDSNESLDKYIPFSKSNTEIVRHTAFILNYREEYEQASWVLHKLVKEAASGTERRSNDFLEDPNVASGSAVTQDYARSGYDRGHLCPAGDFKHDKTLQDETFYMSNMSPQAPDFNRGIWSDLENKVRSWVKIRGELIIVTGPILKKGLPTIGRINQIAVPEQYFKIIFDPAQQQAIAFLFNNEGAVDLVKSHTVSIDEIEALTGIDFFAKLPDSLEKKIETNNNVDDWY